MGVTAAAVDPRRAPKKPTIFEASPIAMANRPQGAGLSVAMAPNILQPLTQLLIDADIARVHLTDIPEKRFAQLGDRQALSEAIPELSRLAPSTEIYGELILASPISIIDSPASTLSTEEQENHAPATAIPPVADASGPVTGTEGEADPSRSEKQTTTGEAEKGSSPAPKTEDRTRALRISAPRVVVALSIRTEPKQAWTPFAELTFSVGQEATPAVDRPTYQDRELSLEWSGQPAIECSARFAPGYSAQNPEIDSDKIRNLFLDAWQGWTREGSLAKTQMNDVNFGLTRLRLADVTWTGDELMLAYSAPGVKVTNGSDVELVYETKGPYSGWGGPYTLAPGRSHEYNVASPLTYRRKIDGTFSMFTLPAGSHVEFRRPAEGKEPSLVQLFGRAAASKPTATNAPSKP
jgi:hypothetical protein